MSLESRLERLLAGHAAPLREAVTASRLLLRAAHLLERHIDAVLAPHGLTMRDYLALVLIADEAHEPLRPSDLSITLDATRTQITRLLDGLEAKGLARRAPGVSDRRSLQLAPTEAGTALLATVAPAVRASYLAAWAPLGEQGTQQTGLALRRLHEHLAGDGA
ncbi:MarR family transcriptional regulator [Ottowia sp.]|uniref:MarR family winged helix-turn-helix transcriptional regulator n=1 Tax=Ottowia sp. TaxID=1898956 RepID=UPI002603B69E|nr:MarR family transcriptional regulator [Ottowia sp.]